MLFRSTFLAIFFVPLFFVVVMRLFNRTSPAGHPPAAQTPATVTEVH